MKDHQSSYTIIGVPSKKMYTFSLYNEENICKEGILPGPASVFLGKADCILKSY